MVAGEEDIVFCGYNISFDGHSDSQQLISVIYLLWFKKNLL